MEDNINTTEEIRFPFWAYVNYNLANEFSLKVEEHPRCKVINVCEYIRCELLLFIIKCPKEMEELITEYSFMTFVKNPEFQKYYKEADAFKIIADKYLQDAEVNELKL